MSDFRYCQLERDDDNLAWLNVSIPEPFFYATSHSIFQELDKIIREVHESHDLRALLICLNTDRQLSEETTEASLYISEADALSQVECAQQVLSHLAELSCPSVAMISGRWSGLALEMALACQYRVGCDDKTTTLIFDQLHHGLHPGLGGCSQLFHLFKVWDVFSYLKGMPITVRQASKAGLLDVIVPRHQMHHAAKHLALGKEPCATPTWFNKLLSHRMLRPWLARRIAQRLEQSTIRSHYPAAFAVLDLWLQHIDQPQHMKQEEALSLAHLMTTKTAINLQRRTLLASKNNQLSEKDTSPVNHVHIYGDVSAAELATWCVLHGTCTTVQCADNQSMADIMAYVYQHVKTLLKNKHRVTAALDRLIPDTKGYGMSRADIIIACHEPGNEDALGHARTIAEGAGSQALLATTSSRYDLASLHGCLKNPNLFFMLHLQYPINDYPLVELGCHPETDTGAIATMENWLRSMGLQTLTVKAGPGLFAERVLAAYLHEALILVDEGVSLAIIDKAAREFGMLSGPLELADRLGLDYCQELLQVSPGIEDIYHSETLDKRVRRGKLGVETGSGFYRYRNRQMIKPKMPKSSAIPIDIQDRLIMRLLNEVVACQGEGVITDTDNIDLASMQEIGFAPFRGGAIRYIETRGVEQCLKLLETLVQRYGERFTADKGWDNLIKQE